MEYDAVNLLQASRNLVLLKWASSVPAALRLTGELLFNRKVDVAPYVFKEPKILRKGKPAFRWGWYSNAFSSTNDIKVRFPRLAPLRGTFEPYREGRHVAFANLPCLLSELDGPAFDWLYAKIHHCDVLGTSKWQRYTHKQGLKEGKSFADVEFATKEEAEAICQAYNGKISFQGVPVKVQVRRPPMKHLGASWDPGHNRAHDQPRDYGSAKNTNFEEVCPFTFYIRSLTVAVKDSGLTVLRCKTRCIGDGYSENTIADCGWQATSIELGLLVAVEEASKQRAWPNLITPTTQQPRRNRHQLMQILILHAPPRRVWNSGHCLQTLLELAHVCDDAQDLTCELAAGCKDERLGPELAKVDARQTVERRGNRLAGTRL
jgi:hypothetical protein